MIMWPWNMMMQYSQLMWIMYYQRTLPFMMQAWKFFPLEEMETRKADSLEEIEEELKEALTKSVEELEAVEVEEDEVSEQLSMDLEDAEDEKIAEVEEETAEIEEPVEEVVQEEEPINEEFIVEETIEEEPIKEETAEKEEAYCGLKGRSKYHKVNCSSLTNSKKENIIYFSSLEEAKEGRTPCDFCLKEMN